MGQPRLKSITLDEISALLEGGQPEECLNSIKPFLLFNPLNKEALFLRAHCEFQLAKNAACKEEITKMFQASLKCFERILLSYPDHIDALLHAAYIEIYELREVKQAINYCKRIVAIAKDDKTRIQAIEYRLEAYCLVNDGDNAITDIHTLICFYKQAYGSDRSELDARLSTAYLLKADILRHIQRDIPGALSVYKEAYNYAHENCHLHCEVANFALDNGDFELGGKAFLKAFWNAGNGWAEVLKTLYDKVAILMCAGIENRDMVEGRFLALMTNGKFFPDVNIPSEILRLANHYNKKYPDWDIPFFYGGSVLFLEKKYEEALPYLRKSVQPGGKALGLQRLIEAEFRVTGNILAIEQWPEDGAIEYFEAGVNFFFNFEEEVRTSLTENTLRHLRKAFFGKAYSIFYDYFYNGVGTSETNNACIFAFCCNNYGIVLNELGAYEKAIEIHKTGYSVYPCLEQFHSWANALQHLGRNEEARAVLDIAFTKYHDKMDFVTYLELKGMVLELLLKMKKTVEAKQVLKAIEIKCREYLDQKEISVGELFEVDKYYMEIRDLRKQLVSGHSLSDMPELWKKKLQKNPDDCFAWILLVQDYYLAEEYKQCIACADNFFSIKNKTIKKEILLNVLYRRGVSYLKTGCYHEAVEDLKIALELHGEIQPLNKNFQSILCTYLAEATSKTK